MRWHYLGSFGPLLAAGVVTLVSRGLAGCRELFGRVLVWRVEPGYYLFAVAPIVVFAVIVLVTWLISGTMPDVGLLGEADYLGAPGVLPVLVLWMVTFGLGEEVGWRGFALPRLQATRSALRAALVLGLFWAVWHLPAVFYRDTYTAMRWMVLPMLLSVAVVGTVVYTWLFNGTRGTLFLVIIFHGLFDFFSVWAAAGPVGPGMVMTILMVFWAVRVYKIYGPQNLAPHPKVVT
jgi:membrane protease YdiL (CAAX protease family)